MADPPPEMRKKISVSFLAFLQQRQRGAGCGEGVLVGQRMAALKVAEAPVAVLAAIWLVAADAAQALAALHAVEQSVRAWARRLCRAQ